MKFDAQCIAGSDACLAVPGPALQQSKQFSTAHTLQGVTAEIDDVDV